MMRDKPKAATIDFLPVCSNCYQVLWGQEIKVEADEILVHFDVYEARYKAHHNLISLMANGIPRNQAEGATWLYKRGKGVFSYPKKEEEPWKRLWR